MSDHQTNSPLLPPSAYRRRIWCGHQHVWDIHAINDVIDRVLHERDRRHDQFDKVTRMVVERDAGRLLLVRHDLRQKMAA